MVELLSPLVLADEWPGDDKLRRGRRGEQAFETGTWCGGVTITWYTTAKQQHLHILSASILVRLSLPTALTYIMPAAPLRYLSGHIFGSKNKPRM